ncbi:hypothetical protein ScalyP_jg7702 [Parmales sp. scaly parma]|nr:hypothetical protein ScalyP_jg7702 [Parmales sp. scaly parma]
MRDGTVALYTNNNNSKSIKTRYNSCPTSISYQEFSLMQRSSDDNIKLLKLLCIGVAANKQLAYAIYFFPEMLPSTYTSPELNLQRFKKNSIDRSHRVFDFLLKMEKAAVNPSFFGKLVPFGNGEAKRMEGALLANQKVKKMLNSGVDDAFASLQDLSKNRINEIILASSSPPPTRKTKTKTKTKPKTKSNSKTKSKSKIIPLPKPYNFQFLQNLGAVPSPALQFLGSCAGISYATKIPNYFCRTQVKTHVERIKTTDNFFLQTQMDLNTLSRYELLEVCNDRSIGSFESSDARLRAGFATWLNNVKGLKTKDKDLNKNLALENTGIACLYGINCVTSVRDEDCGSTLHRALFENIKN